MDTDGSQHLCMEELVEVIEKFKLPIPVTHVNEVFFQVLDKDGDGRVSYHEFAEKLKQWEGAAQ